MSKERVAGHYGYTTSSLAAMEMKLVIGRVNLSCPNCNPLMAVVWVVAPYSLVEVYFYF
jgi:uncharacterized protein (UPF0212 family)